MLKLALIAVFAGAALATYHPSAFAIEGLETSFEVTPSTRAPVPPDDHTSNYGDLKYGKREEGDDLLVREVLMNPYGLEQQDFRWEATIPGYNISHVRVFQVGRQHGLVNGIFKPENANTYLFGSIAPETQFRLVVEVFGKPE